MSISFKPKVVGWEITKRCNMRCIHCGSRAGEPRENELTVEEGLKLCDDLAEMGCEIVTLSGGEPLTHPSFDVYAKRLIKLGIRTFLITNGFLVEEKIDKIIESGIKQIAISVDGMKENHNFTRQNEKSYDKIFGAARLLKKNGIKVGACTHVSKININDLEDMYKKFVDEGFDFWQIQITFMNGRMQEHRDLSCNDDDLIRIAKFMEEKRKEKKLVMVNGDNFGYYSSYDITDTKWKGCYAGRWLMGIDADGAVKGCLSLPREFVEGNIKERSLKEIWEDKNSFKYNRYFSLDDMKGKCKSCDKAKECRGGCTVTAYSATGEVHNNPYCLYLAENK